jgi:hypothetical protein
MHLGRRTVVRTLLAGLFVLLVWVLPSAAPATQAGSATIRVLFIGNSYTYFNNLPELLSRLAEAGRLARVETVTLAPGGWRLKDHWEKGAALKTLREGKFDYVVLQEQSTLGVNYFLDGKSRVANDEVFRPYAERWIAEIKKAGATPVFYLTWARKATPEDQGALTYAYMRAAKQGQARVAPVGLAWARVRQRRPSLELFYVDGSHPGPAGSYLAACTLYATLLHQSPVGLPPKVIGVPVNLMTATPDPSKTEVLVDLPPDEARELQEAAWTVVQQLEKNGGYLDVSPVPPSVSAPLPAGTPISPSTLEGTWSGSMLFYPSGPTQMILQLRFDGGAWKGHLDLKFNSKDQADESFDLTDFGVSEREIVFTDPRGLQGLAVHFRGVSPEANSLRGIADATQENPESPVRLLGTWNLRRK